MSIMSEYQEIRKNIGEKDFQLLEKFLEEKKLLLSDVYYSMKIFNEFQEWKKSI